ncbi:PREDICTED: saccharopine dehydrogenase-like oxidoreductase [Galeopterus variegatus]|uniref:Saccharopine dehydrogenase-like oxidoreductase n=1 Tax=Galeopterus variegatus TaxID=482537 RepID=A0ABM0REK3_GALVR|nr:PREDICTED: saccharopine dehydrogenase-like oxidoreductase [Galeopterus variegatus]
MDQVLHEAVQLQDLQQKADLFWRLRCSNESLLLSTSGDDDEPDGITRLQPPGGLKDATPRAVRAVLDKRPDGAMGRRALPPTPHATPQPEPPPRTKPPTQQAPRGPQEGGGVGVVLAGPGGGYRFYGEPIVKACIENGTSCIDISGEPQFLELIQLKYHEKAAEKGVYIIGSSGFDSIPADLGVIYTRNKMNGTLTAMESFLTIHSGPEGLCIHDGTWKSAIYSFGNQSTLRKLRNASNLKPVPIIGPKLKRRWPISYCRELNRYSIPFLGSDVSVVKRTQRYLHENLGESPVQYAAYVTVGSVTSVIKLMFAGLFFLFFVRFGIGRQLLLRFPWLFSFGYFSKQGPTQTQIDASSFTLTFFGQGYSKCLGTDQKKPNMKICTQVKGPEAGYVATSIAMVQAAMTLLNDVSDLPKAGGVFTPGAAFSRTKLIDRLNQRGIEFSVISSSEV